MPSRQQASLIVSLPLGIFSSTISNLKHTIFSVYLYKDTRLIVLGGVVWSAAAARAQPSPLTKHKILAYQKMA